MPPRTLKEYQHEITVSRAVRTIQSFRFAEPQSRRFIREAGDACVLQYEKRSSGLTKQGKTDHRQQDEILKDLSAEFQSAVERADGMEEEGYARVERGMLDSLKEVELSREVLEAEGLAPGKEHAGAKDEEKERRRESAMVLRSEIEKCRRMGLLRAEVPERAIEP